MNKLDIHEKETADITHLVKGLSETDLAAAVSQCWSRLCSDTMRINFCSALAKNNMYTVILCRSTLLPWVNILLMYLV